MKIVNWIFIIIFFVGSSFVNSQSNYFRNGVFLHHSTGGCIWNSNGTTNVPEEINKYNSENNLTGPAAFAIDERSWPETPWNNEWERWHRIFENKDTLDADIKPIILENKIVIIKSCFPSSNVWSNGGPADTLNPENKTVYNYKWHWRNIIRAMKNHPDNFFVIWTNAPLVASSTNDEEANLSHEFCLWAKDSLAAGVDSEIGQFPMNIYVFDFFHKLVDADWQLKPEYAASEGDSHPNQMASELVAPQFIKEVFEAAIEYEKIFSDVGSENVQPDDFTLEQNFPNPFNPSTIIKYSISERSFVNLTVFDLLGREITVLVNEEISMGSHSALFDASNLSSGIYFYGLKTGNGIIARKMMVLR